MSDYTALLKRASMIDSIDAVLGPTEALLRAQGSGISYAISFGLRVIEETVIKIPFMIDYCKQTKDYAALIPWISSEVLATTIPFGDAFDILPIYHMRTEQFIARQSQEKI